MTKKEKKIVEEKIDRNLNKISKKATRIVNNFCNGTLARGVTAHQLAKVLR
ncbi:MAG: hypothetical protein PHI86_08005 [Candidatus Omnitrophica bacterium]|nr:hypothetical protein [Candidatus Omnitrophota bacterium]